MTSARPLFRFRLLGIPVHVQGLFVVLLAVSAFAGGDLAYGAIWASVVAASILWHELGHALAMRALGHPPWIELTGFGGLAHWPEEADPTAGEAILVVAAGPGAGLLLGAAAWVVGRSARPLPPLGAVVVGTLVSVNVVWSLFNLLPLLPLDGARLLDAVTRRVNGSRAPRWVGWASLVTGAGVLVWGLTHGDGWVAFLGGAGAAMGFSRARLADRFVRAPARRPVDQARAAAQRARARGDLRGVAAALLPEARLGALPERELAELVGALLRLGREAELVALCRERLTAFARKADAAILARLAAEALGDDGAYEEAAEVAQLAFQQLRVPYHAYDAACHLVQLGRDDQAIEWLERAVAAGLELGEALQSDPALEPLRDRPGFQELAARARRGPATA